MSIHAARLRTLSESGTTLMSFGERLVLEGAAEEIERLEAHIVAKADAVPAVAFHGCRTPDGVFGYNVLFADGSIRFVPNDGTPSVRAEP